MAVRPTWPPHPERRARSWRGAGAGIVFASRLTVVDARVIVLALSSVATTPCGAVEERAARPSGAERAPTTMDSPKSTRAVSVDEIAVPGDLPAFVLRGATGDARMVFLHGMCGHGQGYVQAFQGAAAKHGTAIAMMGDAACGGNPAFRTWTLDIARIDARIEAAFAAAGLALRPTDEVVLIGMSQGAMRAEALLGRFPHRYRRAIFMGAPRWPEPSRVGELERAVLMAGEFEGTWAPKQAALALERRKVATLFVPIPKSNHAELREGEATMKTALDFVFSDRPAGR